MGGLVAAKGGHSHCVFLTQNGASGNLWARTSLCLGRRSPNYRVHVDVRFRVTSHGRDWLSVRESTASSGSSSRCPSSPARYHSRTRFLFQRVSVPLCSETAHRSTSNPWSHLQIATPPRIPAMARYLLNAWHSTTTALRPKELLLRRKTHTWGKQ